MKSSVLSEQLSSWDVGVTAKDEVRDGLLVGCQRVFVTEGCRGGSIVGVCEVDG